MSIINMLSKVMTTSISLKTRNLDIPQLYHAGKKEEYATTRMYKMETV
jgi:hypothetical protein